MCSTCTRLNVAVLVLAILHFVIAPVLVFSTFGVAWITEAGILFEHGLIWNPLWMGITGIVGMIKTCAKRGKCHDALAYCFFISTVISTVNGVAFLCICILAGINFAKKEGNKWSNLEKFFGLALGFGLAECMVGIFAAVCTFLILKPCKCYFATPPQEGQVVYTANGAFFLVPGSNGVPVAIPIQGRNGMVESQTVTRGAQEDQPTTPVSIVESYQTEQVQAGTTDATGYQALHFDLPPPYEEQQRVDNVM